MMMKRTPAFSIICLLVFVCCGCEETGEDPPVPEDIDDLTTSSEITPYGGELQLTDDSGNRITVTFPPASLKDTVTVTFTIVGKYRELAIDERQLRVFKILPADLDLYVPVEISVEFSKALNDIEQVAIFHLFPDELMAPLGEHAYPGSGNLMTATALSLGEFAEGRMSLQQLNTQIDRLASYRGITWKKSRESSPQLTGRSSGCEAHKGVWDDWAETAASFLKFFELRFLLGYYDDLPPGERSFQEDVEKVCSNIIRQGVKAVLDLGVPSDPCCSDYVRTMETMMKAMTNCGIQGDTFDQLSDMYDQTHGQCHTYLDITTEVNIASGGLLIMNSGEVTLTLTGSGGGEATVSGTGDLAVAGSGDAGGECTATITGQTSASVTGTRDAAYVYALTVHMNQAAMMTTVCPDLVMETPLVGGSSRQLTLGPGNGFTISESEATDEGTVQINATLHNPYVPVPDPD